MNPADFKYFLTLGWHHIISWGALDHLYFMCALSVVYQFKQWRQVLVLVTAFTVGHAATLFLSALDLIRFNENWVEFAIPCTILFSCLVNLWKKTVQSEADRMQYALALIFGLVHGMGYANAIRFMISSEQHMVWSLFGFNVGLEIGQIFVVLLVLAVGTIVTQTKIFNTREWILSSSSLIIGLALKLAIERYPF